MTGEKNLRKPELYAHPKKLSWYRNFRVKYSCCSLSGMQLHAQNLFHSDSPHTHLLRDGTEGGAQWRHRGQALVKSLKGKEPDGI